MSNLFAALKESLAPDISLSEFCSDCDNTGTKITEDYVNRHTIKQPCTCSRSQPGPTTEQYSPAIDTKKARRRKRYAIYGKTKKRFNETQDNARKYYEPETE